MAFVWEKKHKNTHIFNTNLHLIIQFILLNFNPFWKTYSLSLNIHSSLMHTRTPQTEYIKRSLNICNSHSTNSWNIHLLLTGHEHNFLFVRVTWEYWLFYSQFFHHHLMRMESDTFFYCHMMQPSVDQFLFSFSFYCVFSRGHEFDIRNEKIFCLYHMTI